MQKNHGDVTVHFVGMNASAATIASLTGFFSRSHAYTTNVGAEENGKPTPEEPKSTIMKKIYALIGALLSVEAFAMEDGPEATAAAAYINNNDNVYIVEDMKGRFRVIGSDKWDTKSTVAQDNGQGATGTTSTTISVEATDEVPAPFYEGTIVTEDGIINGEETANSGATDMRPSPFDGDNEW